MAQGHPNDKGQGMTLKFRVHNPGEPSDDSLDDPMEFSGSPHGSASGAVILPPPVVPPPEAVQAQSAQTGPGGPGSVVAVTSGGFTINLIFDSAAMAAPASFRAGIEQAAALLSSAISDKITVNLNIDYGGTGGG